MQIFVELQGGDCSSNLKTNELHHAHLNYYTVIGFSTAKLYCSH